MLSCSLLFNGLIQHQREREVSCIFLNFILHAPDSLIQLCQ